MTEAGDPVTVDKVVGTSPPPALVLLGPPLLLVLDSVVFGVAEAEVL